MEYRQEEQQEEQHMNKCGGLFVKIMTDEQMELLREQISLYATICDSLIDMHKALFQHQNGMKLGMESVYCESFMRGGHRHTVRQRWNPTPHQLNILEMIFNQGNGNPSKQKIKEMTDELSEHGHISETNVYNWFQNRRARSKRKHSAIGNNTIDSFKNKKPEITHSHEPSSAAAAAVIASNETCNNVISLDAICNEEVPLDLSLTSSAIQGLDHLHGIIESPGDFMSYWHQEYDMFG